MYKYQKNIVYKINNLINIHIYNKLSHFYINSIWQNFFINYLTDI